jgi:hypothetical protein
LTRAAVHRRQPPFQPRAGEAPTTPKVFVLGDVLSTKGAVFSERRRDEHVVAVADADGAVEELVDVDELHTRGEGLWGALDDVERPLIVDRQTVGQSALLFPAKNLVEVVARAERPVER